MSRSLPGFSAPAASFDQPFEMMEACHDRVQRSLDLLERIVRHIDENGHDAQSRSAVQDVLRYFNMAAPHHHEDEERHVFPLLEHSPDARLRQAVATLKADHVRMARLWADLRPRLQAWLAPDAPALTDEDRALVRRFTGIYATHIPLEETLAYPAAQALLEPQPLAEMGAEMAARRKSK